MQSKIPSIIGNPEDGRDFRNQRVHVRYGSNDSVNLTVSGEVTNFIELLGLRKQSQDPSELEAALTGEGYLFANVGISGVIITRFKGNDYLLATRADRVDRDDPDTVAKLLSGYVPAFNSANPGTQMVNEIMEELLPMVDGKVIPVILNRKKLSQIYDATHVSDPTRSLQYHSDLSFSMTSGNNFNLPGTKKGTIRLENLEGIQYQLGPHTEFQAAADTNSGQIFFRYTMELPNIEGLNLQLSEKQLRPQPLISLHHSEDKLRPQTPYLDTHFHEEGILLLSLDENMELRGDAYTLRDGRLKSYDVPVMLTEAFAPKQNGISSVGSISLKDYIEM
jgi:hypothetical protein